MKRYKATFGRMLWEFNAENETAARLAAQRRWGLQDSRAKDIIITRVNEDGTTYHETSQ